MEGYDLEEHKMEEEQPEQKDQPFYPPKKGLKKRKDAEWLGFTYKGGNEEDIDKFQQNVEKKVEGLHINEKNQIKQNQKIITLAKKWKR